MSPDRITSRRVVNPGNEDDEADASRADVSGENQAPTHARQARPGAGARRDVIRRRRRDGARDRVLPRADGLDDVGRGSSADYLAEGASVARLAASASSGRPRSTSGSCRSRIELCRRFAVDVGRQRVVPARRLSFLARSEKEVARLEKNSRSRQVRRPHADARSRGATRHPFLRSISPAFVGAAYNPTTASCFHGRPVGLRAPGRRARRADSSRRRRWSHRTARAATTSPPHAHHPRRAPDQRHRRVVAESSRR